MVSVWEKETFYAPQDIIIIGSGFVGLWSAFYLKKRNPGIKITIVDRGIVPTGASTRNAGFACFGSLTELLADEQKMGTDNMLSLVEMRYRGLEKIRAVFSKKQIDMEMCGGYELFPTDEDFLEEDLMEQITYLNHLLKPIVKKKTYTPADKSIRGFGFSNINHLVRNNLEGYLHPGRLTRKLLQTLQSSGVQVLNGVEIKKITEAGSQVSLESNLPVPLTATRVLIGVNGFAKQLLPDLDVEPARGQVLVTSPIKKLPWKGTFHYQQGFYYFRNLGDRVLLGGARNIAIEAEHTFSQETTSLIQDELENFLRTVILPGKQFTIEHRWSGTMGIGQEKTPIIRELSPSVFCCVRMSGMGVALAPVLGEKMAKMMTA